MEGWWWVSFCVCVYVCACTGEWMRMWVSEWVKWKEVKWSEVKRSEVKWCEWVYEWLSEWVNDEMSESDWMSVNECDHIVPRLPCKSHQQCTLSHACHAKEAETQGRQRNPGAYIRPLGSAHCPTPATQKRRRPMDASGTPGRTSDPLAVHIVPRLPRKRRRQRNFGAYIQHLGSAHCPTPATQKRRRPRDASGTPGRTSDPLAVHIVPRLPRKRGETEGRQRNPGAYIRPLDSAHCPTPATQKRRRPRDASAEPQGVHPTPWQCTLSHACHAKEAETGTPAEPRGVHPTPWQCTLSHACHAKEAETQGRQRNPGAYIRPPWQCTLSHACHAKEAETQGHQRNPWAYIRPLDSAHCPIVPRLPWCVRVCECVCVWVSEWVSVCEWVSECVRVCVWVRWGGGRAGEEEEEAAAVAAADTELKTKTPHVNVGNNSNHLSVHQWIRSAIRGSQQLPPPPCAVLLVWTKHYNTTVNYMLVFDIVLKLLY